MWEQEVLARQGSVTGGDNENARVPADALQGLSGPEPIGEIPATAPDPDIVDKDHAGPTKRAAPAAAAAAAESEVLKTAAAAVTADACTRAMTTAKQVKEARDCVGPASDVGINSNKALPVSGMASAVVDTGASARAVIARVAATTLSEVSERAVNSLTSALDILSVAESRGSIRAPAQTEVDPEAAQSRTSSPAAKGEADLFVREVSKSAALTAPAAALPSETTIWHRHAASAYGGEDEAEKEFQALSPIKRYLVSQQQQKEQKPTQDRAQDDEVSLQQESNTVWPLPGLKALQSAKAGDEFTVPSAASPSKEVQQEPGEQEKFQANITSAGDVPVPPTVVEEDVLPAFANEQNQRLHAEIQAMRKGMVRITAKIAEREERTQMLSEHLKHVLLELQQTSRIAAAKKESIRTEEHMAALRQRHASQLQRQTKDLAKRIETYAEQLLSLNTEMVAGSARLDQFKLQMNWNAAELKQWSVAENQKQQDRLQVERLQRADDREVKKLTLTVEKLCRETHQLKEKLHQQTTQARGLHVELESAALHFNGLQQERLRLIGQWEAALESMQQRDEAIQHAAARYSMAQEEIQKKLAHLDSMQKFKNEQSAANEELQRHLLLLEKTATKLRDTLASAKSRLNVVNASGEELRTQLSATTSAAAKTRKEIEHLQEQLEQRKQQLASLKRRFTMSQKRLENELQKAGSEDEAFKKVEAFCKQLEEDCKTMEKKMKRSRQLLFEEVQQHVAQQADTQATQAELNSSKAALRNLLVSMSRSRKMQRVDRLRAATQLHKLDQDRQRQQELLYAVEFQSQVMQRKVARVAGYRGTAEKKQLLAKIEKLTQLLEQQQQQVQMLTTQLRRLESELRKAQREQQIRQREALTLTDVLGDLRLECDSLRRDATDRQKEKESLYVDHDTLHLEVKKLQDQLRASSTAACAAEVDKQQVQAQIEEEILEAENRLELVRTAARVACEERHKLSMELASRKTKILNLESKYAVLIQKIKADDGDDVERSQAYYIIKASQEKQDLQRVGDELDQKIRDAEQESRSLELTLQQLRQRNRHFKKSLDAERHYVQHERENRKDFEAQLVEFHDRIYEQQQLAKGLRKEKQAEERRVNETLQHLNVLLEKLESARGALRNSKLETTEQLEKLRRAERQHRKMQQAARAKKLLPDRESQNGAEAVCEGEVEECPFFYDPTRQSTIEMEPHLEGLKAHMHALLHSLAIVLRDSGASFPAAAVAVEEALAAHGLALPSRPPSVVASSDGRSVSGSNSSSSGSMSRSGESNLRSRGSSVCSSASVSHQPDGLPLSINGVSSSNLSSAHQLVETSSRSAQGSVVSSAEGHVLTGNRLQLQKANGGRAATVESPLSSFVKSANCKALTAGRLTASRKADTGSATRFLEDTSNRSKRACPESADASPKRTASG